MESSDYPLALRDRLGSSAAAGLAEVLAAQRDEIVTFVSNSFERRLSEECGKLKTEVRVQVSELRGELLGAMGELRGEVRGDIGELRGEMNALRHEFKAEVADVRSDLLKWSFLFWVSQLAAVVGLVKLLP